MAHPRDADATRTRILEAASSEFGALGIAGARIDRIAEKAGANKAMIYRYFGNKDDLFDAVFTAHVVAFVDAVQFDGFVAVRQDTGGLGVGDRGELAAIGLNDGAQRRSMRSFELVPVHQP